MTSLKIVFAGTPHFAAVSLTALAVAGHDIALVLTQPDRPAGRGMRLTPCAVAQEAQRLGCKLAQPATLRNAESEELIRAVGADVMVVAAYGQLLPPNILALPRHGCLNVHASLLPRWRGAAPVARAIEAGDAETGVCIMQMDAGLDTGPVILERRIAIAADDTSASLTEKLATHGAQCLTEVLANFPWQARSQPAEGATYAKKIGKAEAHIDWSRPATEIERRLRAFDPFPGAESVCDGASLKIWRAQLVKSAGGLPPGTVIDSGGGLVVQCGEDALALQIVQRPGGKRLPIEQFLRGFDCAPGARLT